jgi:uncharacterized membrane protein HdeD (DUF308 family)
MLEEKNISVVVGDSEEETRVPLIFQVPVEIVLGIFLIIYRDMTTNVLFIVIGALMVCYGVFDLIAFITNNRNYSFRRGLTSGVLITIIGVAFIVQAETLKNLLAIIIGALILIESIVNCRRAVILKNFGYDKWTLVLFTSFGAMALGILICIYPGIFGEAVSLIMGIGVIFEALIDAFAIITMSYFRGKAKKSGKYRPEDTTAIVEAETKNK